MCGIAGIYAYGSNAKPVDAGELESIRDFMVHRGPDGSGILLSPDRRIGLAHRRLSIIDIGDGGRQPMLLENSGTAIVFNGEIYNYRELRQQLEQHGRVFRSNSDTEVLLHCYEEFGPRMVDYLRGMYAFAIWDPHRGGVFLARDPFGIKPLYYTDDNQTFAFASQVKALRSTGRWGQRLNASGQVSFLLWGFIIEPYTMYEDIRALPAGSTLWIDAAGPHLPEHFWSVNEVLNEGQSLRPEMDLKRNFSDTLNEIVYEALEETIHYHLVADVPVGVFLSGGLDSGSLVSIATEGDFGDVRTLTLGFDELIGTIDDETIYAEQTASVCHTSHSTKFINSDQFSRERVKLMNAMDQPSVDGVNTYFVSRMCAAEGLKVAISGLGGDELFGGYPSFTQIPYIVKKLSSLQKIPTLGRNFRRVAAPVLRLMTSPKYAGILEYGTTMEDAYILRRGLFMPWELPDILGPEVTREGWSELSAGTNLHQYITGIHDARAQVMALEMSVYMRNQLLCDSDWAGMAHSIEIRVPFVDHVLFRQLSPFLFAPTRLEKNQMVNGLRRPLPQSVLNRPKSGFTVPVREWLIKDHVLETDRIERGLRGWAKYILQEFVA
jgi:asparagine synthase (glutamine-hydrolysing)